MKHLLLLSILAFMPLPSNETYVYICMGPASECYHKDKLCRGIKNCSRDVKKVTLTEAREKYRRRPCGYCYGRRR